MLRQVTKCAGDRRAQLVTSAAGTTLSQLFQSESSDSSFPKPPKEERSFHVRGPALEPVAPRPKRSPRRTSAVGPLRDSSSESDNLVIQDDPNDAWTAVLDKQSGGTYWWNKSTGEVTAVGEAKPGPLRRRQVQLAAQPVSFGRGMLSIAAMGLGFGLVFGIIGKIF